MSRRSTRTVLSILAVGALAACGGGGGSSPKSPPSEEALEKAVADFGDAIFTGESSTAYAYFTKECRQEVSKSDFALLSQLGLSFIEGFADVKASDLRIGDVEIRDFSETSAEARAEVRDKNGDLFSDVDSEGWTAWTYEDGGWHTSDCEDYNEEGLAFDEGGELEIDAFDYPSCTDLVDGEPIPDEFGSGSDLDISCDDGDLVQFGYTTTCFTSTREYAVNDVGYVFLDEGVFRAGEVRGCSPPCSDLVDGEPVPSAFDDESIAGFNLNCEPDAGGESYSFEWECFESDRLYVENDEGYAYSDDRIFVAGTPDYC